MARLRYPPTLLLSLRPPSSPSPIPPTSILFRPPPPILPPHPITPPTPFSALSLPPPLLSALHTHSFTTATPVQATFLPLARLGVDAIIHAPAASGKTLAFLIAALECGRVLVLVPTRELAIQIATVCKSFDTLGIHVVTVIGGVKETHGQALTKADIIVATPGRLLAILTKYTPDLSTIRALVLDEADQLLDPCFHSDINHLTHLLPARQTFAFSATFENSLHTFLASLMRQPVYLKITATSHVNQRKIPVRNGLTARIGCLIWLLSTLDYALCIVFADMKSTTLALHSLLSSQNIRCRYIHSGLSQAQRSETIRETAVTPCVLVTTDLLARGIDLPNCDLVVQLHVPARDVYRHRVGRAGRGGSPAAAYLMYAAEEEAEVRELEMAREMEVVGNGGEDVGGGDVERAMAGVAVSGKGKGKKRGGKRARKRREREEEKPGKRAKVEVEGGGMGAFKGALERKVRQLGDGGVPQQVAANGLVAADGAPAVVEEEVEEEVQLRGQGAVLPVAQVTALLAQLQGRNGNGVMDGRPRERGTVRSMSTVAAKASGMQNGKEQGAADVRSRGEDVVLPVTKITAEASQDVNDDGAMDVEPLQVDADPYANADEDIAEVSQAHHDPLQVDTEPCIVNADEAIQQAPNSEGDEWDRYARQAYEAGYRRAYEDAYRMAMDLKKRLGIASV